MSINTNKLRKDLMDYYGTAMSNGFPMAVIDLGKAEHASEKELIRIAKEEDIDLSRYMDEGGC